jgi:hypothetical protein
VATSVNVVNSTTLTAVAPAHAVGAVDVVVATASGSGTLLNGYTNVTTSVGQSAYGGTIACLNGGAGNLIAASADNSSSIAWGAFGVTTTATSSTDGSTNTNIVVATVESGSYAAKVCYDYEVDSQGNTPCEAGNTCYNDWFLAARNQLDCNYSNRVSIGGFSATNYWSSSELSSTNSWAQSFSDGSQFTSLKNSALRVRCVRAFTP